MKPRVGFAGLLHESNTFLNLPTTYENFSSCSLPRGEGLIDRCAERHTNSAVF
jgi:hypothetical protein